MTTALRHRVPTGVNADPWTAGLSSPCLPALLLCAALAVLGSPTNAHAAAPSVKHRAVSLKILQQELNRSPAAPISNDLRRLSGLTRLTGYVIDDKSKDLIIFGPVDPAAPALQLDDLVVALRNTWHVYARRQGNTIYYENPGCSIDPDPAVVGRLQTIGHQINLASNLDQRTSLFQQWRAVGESPQQVRVLGIPHDSRFAHVMVEADYHMKRLSDGSDELPLPGFASLTALHLRDWQKAVESGRDPSAPVQSINRFWFSPGKATYQQDRGIASLRDCEVVLLTEEEHLAASGRIAGLNRTDPLAKQFADSFTAHYSDIARARPIYAELAQLFRLVALSRLLKEQNAPAKAGLSLDYLLHRYPLPAVPVSRTLPGLANVQELTHRQELPDGYVTQIMQSLTCGGVDMNPKITPHTSSGRSPSRLPGTRTAILTARPSPSAASWDFTPNE